MKLVDLVDTWFFQKAVKDSTKRKIRYEVTNWIRRGGPVDTVDISASVFPEWRAAATQSGLAPRTIESVVSTVAMLCKAHGISVNTGVSMRSFAEIRHTPCLSDLNAVIDAADHAEWMSPNWWRTALCLAFVAGLRLGDLERFDRDMLDDDCIRWRAEKTGKVQRIPLPDVIIPRLAGFRWTIGRKVLRRELNRLCDAAGVRRFTPQAIRRLSAQEWERARAGCGAIILGHDVPGWSKATASYMDKSHILRLGLPALRLPEWIDDGRSADREQSLLSAFRRLGEPQQSALVQVASGMG